MTAKKQRSNNDGAVLLTVLTVACFAAILLTAVLSFVGRAHTNAYNNYNSEQAYYIASSALGSIHDYFEEADGSYTQLMNMATANGNAGTSGTLKFSGSSDNKEISDLISDSNCTVKVSRMGDGYIKVAVTGYCRGQAETINAYYTVEEEKSNGNIDNALYSDGSTSLDVCASSSGPFTSRDSYNIRNNTVATGTVVAGFNFVTNANYTWKSDTTKNAKNYVIVGHNCLLNNPVNFLPKDKKTADGTTPDNTSQFIAVGGMFSVVNGPTQIGDIGGKEMDVYCNNFSMSSNSAYTQYGNIYCYKMTEDEFKKVHSLQTTDLTKNPCDCGTLDMSKNGKFTLKPESNFIVDGSVYIDGEFDFAAKPQHETKISGDLYLGADTKIIYNESTFYNGTQSNVNFSARLTITKLHAPGLTYKDVATLVKHGVIRFEGTTEDWAKNIDPNAGDTVLSPILSPYFDTVTFSNNVPTSREAKPQTDFIDGNYQKSYEPTADYLSKHIEVKTAFEVAANDPTKFDIKNYFVTGGHTESDLNNTSFDYYIDHSNDGVNACVLSGLNGANRNSGQGATIFVDLDKIGADFVIVLKPQWGNSLTFEQNQGNPTIVVKNGEMDENGEWTKKPEHNLYIITAKDDAGYKITGQKFGIFDYYTYKYVCIERRAINIASYIENGEQKGRVFASAADNEFTDKSGTAVGVYTPMPTRTYFMLYNDKDELHLEQGEDGTPIFIEATIYAPKSLIEIPDSYGSKQVYLLKDPDSKKVTFLDDADGTNARLSCLGAIVCSQFKCGNQFGVSFVPPSPDAGIGGGSSSGGTKIEFSHYESR